MPIKDMVKQGIVAALYVAVSLIFAPISYGAIQLRFAEMFKVLPFFNRKFVIGVTLGCFIVNLFSPLGLVDAVFGTLNTLITCSFAAKTKKLMYIAPVTAVVTGLIVGAELHFVAGLPFAFSFAGVALGQLIVISVGAIGAKVLVKNKIVKSLIF